MRRNQVAVFIHLVWATWDRLPLIAEEIERPLHRAISAKCAEFGAELAALGGVEDHIHLLVRLPAPLPLAELVKQVKGASTHLITHQITPVQSFTWQGATARSPSAQATSTASAPTLPVSETTMPPAR